jgi:HEAT repeat protein
MECENYKPQIDLLVTGFLDQSLVLDLKKHLDECPDCRMELEATKKIWMMMGELPAPVPSEVMRANFNAMLTKFKKETGLEEKQIREPVRNFAEILFARSWFKYAAAIVLLLTGVAAGYFLSRPVQPVIVYNKKMDSLAVEMNSMKQMMMLSLLENPSASERIRAVGYTDEMGSSNKKVIDALLTTLNQDPNVNVRLITLEALTKLSKEPSVREGLVQSITRQESPLVQSAIADVMVKLQEKSSVKALQKLLHKKDINEMVKTKIEQSIQKLI